MWQKVFDQQNNLISKILDKNNIQVQLILITVSLGLVVFLFIAFTFPFKDNLLNIFYILPLV